MIYAASYQAVVLYGLGKKQRLGYSASIDATARHRVRVCSEDMVDEVLEDTLCI